MAQNGFVKCRGAPSKIKKKNKRKEKGGGSWPHLSAPRGSWVLRCGCCPGGCRPSALSMSIPAISGDVERQEGSAVIVFDVVFPSMGSDRRDYGQGVRNFFEKGGRTVVKPRQGLFDPYGWIRIAMAGRHENGSEKYFILLFIRSRCAHFRCGSNGMGGSEQRRVATFVGVSG
ncbi:hypothetical protein AAG906_012711 [Vitis piasezkii]